MADARLKQLLSLVEARVLLFDASVQFRHGAREVAAHGAPPRIVWVRDGEGQRDVYSAPTDASAQRDAQRIVSVRRCTVFAHCWGADEARTEELLDLLVWALLEELGPTETTMRGSWSLEGWTNAGSVSVLEFEVAQPVFEPTTPTIAPTSAPFDTTGSSTTDGVLDAGEG